MAEQDAKDRLFLLIERGVRDRHAPSPPVTPVHVPDLFVSVLVIVQRISRLLELAKQTVGGALADHQLRLELTERRSTRSSDHP